MGEHVDRAGSVAGLACAVHCALSALLPTAMAARGVGLESGSHAHETPHGHEATAGAHDDEGHHEPPAAALLAIGAGLALAAAHLMSLRASRAAA